MSGKKKIEVRNNDLISMHNSPIHGLGVYAAIPISIGKKVAYFEGYEIDHNTKYSLTFDNKRIEPTGKLKHLNHSCAPNAFFEGRWLIASRDIKLGEEITIDYESTETFFTYSFSCRCGSRFCKGIIGDSEQTNNSLQRTR